MKTIERDDLAIARETLERVADLAEEGGLLVVTIMETSKSNLSFKLDIRLYYNTPRGVDFLYLNWTYAQLMGAKQDQGGYVKWNGIGIDRAFEACSNLEHLIVKLLDRRIQITHRGVY